MIIKTFNPVFWCLAAFFALLTFVLARILRPKPLKTRKRFLIWFYLAFLALFFVYKYMISIDPEYCEIAGYGEFTWFNELPLNLCNIVLWLTPVAVASMSPALLCFVSFCGLVGPLCAILMPFAGFDGYSIFIPRVAGFYITHFGALTVCPLLAALRIYRPRAKDVLRTVLTLLAISVPITLINWLMRATGVNPSANYLFTWTPENNFILAFFYRLIPVPFLYVLPVTLLVTPLFYLIAFAFDTGSKLIRSKSGDADPKTVTPG